VTKATPSTTHRLRRARSHRLTRVTIEFDGEAIAGRSTEMTACTDDVAAELPESSLTLHQAAHTTKPIPRRQRSSLPQRIEILCYDYLSQTHGGWEINDGAYGTFEFDVPSRGISILDFNERFIDSTLKATTLTERAWTSLSPPLSSRP